MNYNAIDVSNYIIEKCDELKEPITNLKLQKILYYVQAYSLVLLNGKMFREEIRAWPYGPVVKEVYDEFSHCAALPLSKTDNFEIDDVQEREVICKVFIDKIFMDVWDLVEQTHKEEPWKLTMEMFGEGAIIPCDVIKKYFEGKVKL